MVLKNSQESKQMFNTIMAKLEGRDIHSQNNALSQEEIKENEVHHNLVGFGEKKMLCSRCFSQ